MTKYETRTMKLIVAPVNEPQFSERATRIEIMSEAGGEFVSITQDGGHTEYSKSVLIDPEEWPTIRKAIDTMMKACRTE